MDSAQSDGSVGMGFALGFFLGLVGLAIAFFAMKAPLTKKGAIYGLGAQIALACVAGIVLGVVVPMLRS